ncbi:hypothetical protein, partial [Flintibacter porci]|uniref:hypothetical protein n=1 Tax=Flintibacter porci TaxID=3342383 RepID=UPI003F88607D
YRGGAIPFLRLFSISFVPFPFHYNECFFVHQFGKGGIHAVEGIEWDDAEETDDTRSEIATLKTIG